MTGSDHHAARVVLFVPVRQCAAGPVVRVFHTPLGASTAVAFTTLERLTDVLGPEQAWIRLAEPALRGLVGPIGVAQLVVDPTLAAPVPAPVAPVAPASVLTMGVESGVVA